MISPPLLPAERRYQIAFYLALAVIAGVLLSGCGPEGNPPAPRQVCTQVTGIYGCGRGGTCEQCGNWQIGCPKPLQLQDKDDGKGTLICRLEKKPEPTCRLSTEGCQ